MAAVISGTSDTPTLPGSLANGSTTDDTTPSLSGTLSAELAAGQKVQVFDGDTPLQPPATVTGLQWQFTPAAALAQGAHKFSAAVIGADGRTGSRSPVFALTIAVPGLQSVTPTEVVRATPTVLTFTGTAWPSAGLSVVPMTDEFDTCTAPSIQGTTRFDVTCDFQKLGDQPVEIRLNGQTIGQAQVKVTSNVSDVTWRSPSTNGFGQEAVRPGEAVTFRVTGTQLLRGGRFTLFLDDISACTAPTREVGDPTQTERQFECTLSDVTRLGLKAVIVQDNALGSAATQRLWDQQVFQVTPFAGDLNSNAILDWWERRYGLIGSGEAIAAADPDRDGRTNLQEWLAGTDPTVANPLGQFNVSSATPSVGERISIWFSNVWEGAKSIWLDFGNGVSQLIAIITGGSTAPVEQSFSGSAGTISAEYRGADGQAVGLQTFRIELLPLPTGQIEKVYSDTLTKPGLIANGGSTDDTTPTFTGSLSASLTSGQKVKLYRNAREIGLYDVFVNGTTWSITLPTPLEPGLHRFFVVVIAPDGTYSRFSAAYSVYVGSTQVSTFKIPHSGISVSRCFQAGDNTLVACGGLGAIALSGANKQDGMLADIDQMSYSTVGSYSKEECVKDNVTGLMWEGKAASGLRAGVNTYTNFGDGRVGDASAYLAAVNAQSLCGFTDWRLPTLDELQSIVDYGKPFPGPVINTVWFPNTIGAYYWSSSPYVVSESYVWYVDFESGNTVYDYRDYHPIRLVRSVQ
ncbi:MAG: hypothetical protein C4K60_10725 [Ideonella sp. MAG2]|nr:MAG: hypothetical protein C4K60_10725 [Ideonella sp. MAG2]